MVARATLYTGYVIGDMLCCGGESIREEERREDIEEI
jgi:hypothetical protein